MNRQHSDTLKILAANIKRYRSKQGISQERLAELADVSRNYLASIETACENPSLGILVRIADGLMISVSDLISNNEDKRSTRADRIDFLLNKVSDDDAEFLEREIVEWVRQLGKKRGDLD